MSYGMFNSVSYNTVEFNGANRAGYYAYIIEGDATCVSSGVVGISGLAEMTMYSDLVSSGAVSVAGDALMSVFDTHVVSGSVGVSGASTVSQDAQTWDTITARLHLLPHGTGKTLNAHTYPRSLTAHGATGRITRH